MINYKNLIGVIILLLIISPLYIMMFYNFRVNESVISERYKKDSILYEYIDSKNRKVVESTSNEYSQKFFLNSEAPEVEKLRDDLKDLNISLKDFRKNIDVKMEAFGNSIANLTPVDTSKSIFSFSDSINRFIKLEGVVDIKNKIIEQKYVYTNRIGISEYEYKPSFFGKGKMRINLVSEDSSAIFEIKTFTIKTPKPLFSVGLGVGLGLSINNKVLQVRPVLTLGLQYNIWTFYKK